MAQEGPPEAESGGSKQPSQEWAADSVFKPWSSDEEEITMMEGEVSRENKEGVR